MSETSLFWGGTTVGDATLAPYDDDEFSDVFRDLLCSDRTTQGVLFGLENNLAITNPAGLTIRTASGYAFVDGKLYVNDDNTDVTLNAAPGASVDYYTLVLQKDFVAQTVRVALLGPVNGGPTPAVTQTDGTLWEIAIAEITQTSGGTITIIDKRQPLIARATKHHLIERQEGVSAASVTFSSIPTHFKKLVLEGYIVAETGIPASAYAGIQLNGDAGANYDYLINLFTSGGLTTVTATGQVSARLGRLQGPFLTADRIQKVRIEITQNGTNDISIEARCSDANMDTSLSVAYWTGTGPVTSLLFSPNWGGGVTWETTTVWTLYGVA